jgi:hypothetical protein
MKKLFNYYMTVLRKLSRVASAKEKKGTYVFSNKLKAAASRINVPQEFVPYKNYIEENTGKKFTSDVKFTADEVRSVDKDIIKSFSKPNFDFSKLNLEFLFKAAEQANRDLHFDTFSGDVSISLEGAADALPSNTSSGYPIFKRKDNYVSRKDAIDWSQDFIDKPSIDKIFFQPTSVFHRFQYKIENTKGGGYNIFKKIRPVWGVSFRVLLFESFLFRNLVDHYSNTCALDQYPRSATGKTKFEISQTIIEPMRSHKQDIVLTDYTLFDSTVPSFMWALFYASVTPILLRDTSIRQVHLNLMLGFHCFTPYCWNSTKLCFQRKGVPSGCLITSMFNTWVNRVIINYAFLESTSGLHTALNRAVCLGDDLMFSSEHCSFSHFLNVTQRFGMVIRPEKCEIVRYNSVFQFLGYFWDDQNRPFQQQEWYIAHLIMPSRFYRDYPFPISVLQTYRGITVCMSLYKGMKMFHRLIGTKDFVYNELYQKYINDEDPIISYVGEDQRYYDLRIPMSVIFNEGWVSL